MSPHNILRRFAHGSVRLTLSLVTVALLQSFEASAAGTFDILWRNASTGEDSIWVMNGTPLANSAFLQPNIPAPWQIAGTGDFDGDGKPDVLWRNPSTGQNAIWLMNGATTVNSAFLTTIPGPNWIVAAIGDFDGDGKADILWRNPATGENSIWLMNGLSIASSGFLPKVVDPNWTIAGVGSFSGNVNSTTGLLKTDILWRNTATGQNSIWFMDGTTLASSAFITTVAATWSIAGVGDYNGDRKADILWRNSTGENAIWFMNGSSIASSAFAPSVTDSNWKIVGTGDYNGDGLADILWRNSGTGENAVWLMNGASIVSSGFLPKVADANWVPRSPTPIGPPLPTSGTVGVALVGPGTTDPSVHQLVRTSANVLYVIAPDGTTASTSLTTAHLRVYKANVAGTPTSFALQDDAHAPGGGINSSDSAIDGQDRIHTIWIDGGGNVLYAVFDTGTNLWGTPTTLETNANFSGDQTQGDEGVALALDSAGHPHAVWMYMAATNVRRLHYATNQGSGWSTPLVAVESPTPAAGLSHNSWHPAVAFAPNGDFTVAWLEGTGGYALDAIVHTRVRHANGTWDATQTLPETTHVSADNGPSILITADGVRHITFVDGDVSTLNTMRYWYDSGAGWQSDQQPPPTVSHDPVLGPDGNGGLYIYAHGEVAGDPEGVGDGKFRFHKAAHATTWSAFTQITQATGQIDDSTSTRWSQFFHYYPKTVDFTYWTHTNGDPTKGYTIHIGTQAP